MNQKYLVLLGGGIAILANYLRTIYQQYEVVLWLRAVNPVLAKSAGTAVPVSP